MSRTRWEKATISADNHIGGPESFLYSSQTDYPTLPNSPLLIRSEPGDGKRRNLIVRTAWAITQEAGSPLYSHSATLTLLGLRPGKPANIEYRKARWGDVLLYGDKVRLSVAVALLTVISTALTAFVAYQDHSKGSSVTITFIVLVVASLAAIINVFQQFGA